jgi:putative oxidoreductase
MNIAFLIGRIIYGGYFVWNAVNHFRNLEMMSGYARSKGTPAPKLAVAGTGILLLVGGLSTLLGVYPVLGVILLVIFLLGVSIKMHNFWAVQDPQMKMMETVNFTKNMALLGATLMLLVISKPWPFSLPIGQ